MKPSGTTVASSIALILENTCWAVISPWRECDFYFFFFFLGHPLCCFSPLSDNWLIETQHPVVTWGMYCVKALQTSGFFFFLLFCFLCLPLVLFIYFVVVSPHSPGCHYCIPDECRWQSTTHPTMDARPGATAKNPVPVSCPCALLKWHFTLKVPLQWYIFFPWMDNGLLSPLKGAYVCLCACVGVQVTSCAELPVNVPQTPLEAQESPVLWDQADSLCLKW